MIAARLPPTTRLTLLLVALLLGVAPVSSAQPPPFEVVSVKENTTGGSGSTFNLSASQFQPDTPIQGTVAIRNIPLCNLIARAHELSGAQQRFAFFNSLADDGACVAGQRGSSGLLARRFDVVAKPPAGSRPVDVFAMLRTMLVERFQLKMHRETRQLPVYALTVVQPGKLGPGLKPSDLDCRTGTTSDSRPIESNPGLSRVNSIENHVNSGGRVAALVNGIQGPIDRLVVDATGLSGTYEWHYSYARTPDHPTLPNIYTAVREQLGLRLEPRTMPVDVWVIDHVQMPTAD